MEDEKTSFLSSYWQDLNTYVERDGISPREKAEGYRRILNFLDKSRSSKIISEKLYHALYSDAHQKYTSVIDCMNEEEGMNNYMASIKELVSGLRNNSHSWKTSLCMKDSEDIPSFLSEILEKAKIYDQSENQSVLLKYRSTATNIAENTRKACSDDKASSKQAQRSQANNSASFAAPSSASVSTNRNATAEGANASRCIQNNMLGSAVEKGQATRSSTASQFVGRDRSANRNPSRFSRGINGNDKTAEGSLQTQMNASSGIHQQAVFTKRKFEGNLNSSNKQARLEPNIINRTGVPDQPSRGKFTNGCPSTLNLYANSRNEMQDRRERLEQRNELTQGLSSRQYSNPSDLAERNDDIENHETPSTNTFLTARDQYMIEQRAKNRSVSEGRSIRQSDYGVTKKSLGTRRGTSNKFIPPVMNKQQNDTMAKSRTNSSLKNSDHGEGMDERLKNIDQRMIEMIENEIMDHGPAVTWDDIAGLEFAKNTIQEIVIWPMLRPDIFKGLRGPPKGLLLFGPPGTGKTLIGKCIASQSHATFFSISASSLTSKWIGDGEKMVRALFGVARCQESAVIFIDEIDSLLSQRSDGEHEATRRIKTEFLIQLDGATTKAEERILVVGATNRPQELDEAARRRLVKRLYIPLPEAEARKQIVSNLMTEQKCSLDENDLNMIMENSHGYSGADMANLCREAALGPIRSISRQDIRFIKSDEVRPIIYKDFEDAFKNIRPSVSQKDLEVYTQWNKQYGSGGV